MRRLKQPPCAPRADPTLHTWTYLVWSPVVSCLSAQHSASCVSPSRLLHNRAHTSIQRNRPHRSTSAYMSAVFNRHDKSVHCTVCQFLLNNNNNNNNQYIYKQRQSHAMSQRHWLATAVIFRPSDMSLGFAET